MIFHNINQSTLDYDSCIGCAICETVCPYDAIDMIKNANLEIIPVINDKCTNCTVCVTYCPLERNKIESVANKIYEDDPHIFGLKDSNYWLAWNKNNSERVNSASGGAVSEITTKLLQSGMIDAVIHAHALPSYTNELNFSSTISYSLEEVNNRKGSFYQSLDYAKVLQTLRTSTITKYLLIAVPCIITGIKKLVEEHKDYKHIQLYTIALSCSHNVNPQFTSFMAKTANIKKKQEFIANMRAKDIHEPDANNFHTRFTTPSGKILFSQNRFDSHFTNTWRNYLFAKSACLKCADFWGYEADVSIKDAWGKWSTDDVLGKSMVIMRNPELEKLFLNLDNLEIESLSFEEVHHSQATTTQFKQAEVKNKLHKSILSKENIQNGYLKYLVSLKLSKMLYRIFGYKTSLFIFKMIKIIMTIIQKIKQSAIKINNAIQKVFKYISNSIFSIDRKAKQSTIKVKNMLKKVFRYIPQYTRNKPYILILGGYGYANVGDEAQLNVTIKELNVKFQKYELVVLTPDVEYTKKEHNCIAELAPRVSFFDHDIDTYYWLQNEEHKKMFIKSSIRIYITALFNKFHIPISLIGDKKMALLSMVRNSSMIYYSGGGYLTGKTLSRLWDGCLFMSLGNLFKKPVVLSGQTIGLFRNRFDKTISKFSFSGADLITVRDAEDSLKELKSIGIEGSHVYTTFDDALFCDKSTKSLDFLPKEQYVSLQFHYWGVESQADKDLLLENINRVVNYLLESTSYKIVLFGMHMSDLEALDNYIIKYPNNRIVPVGDIRDFSIIRKVIADSEICITMKHHPIIFAVGEKIPVVSLAYDPYYVHKNAGALAVFDLEKFNIDISDNFNLEKIKKLIELGLKEKQTIANQLTIRLEELKKVRIQFLKEVKVLLGNGDKK